MCAHHVQKRRELGDTSCISFKFLPVQSWIYLRCDADLKAQCEFNPNQDPHRENSGTLSGEGVQAAIQSFSERSEVELSFGFSLTREE